MADWLKNGCRGCFLGACVPELWCSSGLEGWVRWRGSPWMRGSNVSVPSLKTPAPWWVLQVGLVWSMWGSSTGPATGSLLGSESRSSGGGTFGRTPYIKRQPNLRVPDRHWLSMGLGRGLGEAQSPPRLGGWKGGGGSLRAGVGALSWGEGRVEKRRMKQRKNLNWI